MFLLSSSPFAVLVQSVRVSRLLLLCMACTKQKNEREQMWLVRETTAAKQYQRRHLRGFTVNHELNSEVHVFQVAPIWLCIGVQPEVTAKHGGGGAICRASPVAVAYVKIIVPTTFIATNSCSSLPIPSPSSAGNEPQCSCCC